MVRFNLKNKIVITLFLIILFYALFATFSDLDKIKQVYQIIKLDYVGFIIAIVILSMFLRSLVQRFLLNVIGINISKKQSYLLFVAGLSMIVTPGGTGQAIKSHFINEKYGYPIPKTFPYIIAERFFDLLAVSLLITITLFLSFSITSLITICISSTILATMILALKNKKAREFFDSLLGRIKILRNLLLQNNEFDNSIASLFQPTIIFKGGILITAITFLEGLAVYLAFSAFNLKMDYFQSNQIYYTSIMLGIFSFIPGGVGVTEGSFVGILLSKGISLSVSTSLVIFIRLCIIWFATALGFITSYFMMSNKGKNFRRM